MMKKVQFIIFFVLMVSNLRAQVPSSCSIPQEMVKAYDRDIAQLAVKHLYDYQSPDFSFVNIPQRHLDTIAEGLAAIYNATSIPESDSVFNLYCVHNHNGWPYQYDGFLVKVDTNYSWTDAWKNLNTNTGDPLMDTILTRYNLQIERFYSWSIGNIALLKPIPDKDSSWNIYALTDSFELVPGVIYAEPNNFWGFPGKIVYDIVDRYRYYNFYFEFNDCFDGCDNYRKWMFRVDEHCSVEYLGFEEYGFFRISPLPPPSNCNLFTSVSENSILDNDWRIFPNPSNGHLQFSTDIELIDKGCKIEIYNISGERIYESMIEKPNLDINLSKYASGIYLVKFIDGQKNRVKKIIIN